MIENVLESRTDPVSCTLKDFCERSVWEYIDYSHEDEFLALWNEEFWDLSSNTGPDRRHILIDWHAYPCQHETFPRITDFITPLDLVLAVYYDLTKKGAIASNLPYVIIVDRYSHKCKDSFCNELRSAVLHALGGYVRQFSALAKGRNGPASLAGFFSNLLDNSGGERALFTSLEAPRQGRLNALRHAWIGYTAQSEDHHDINNLLGPLVLGQCSGGGSVSREGSVLDRALLQASKWLSLCPDADQFHPGWGIGGQLGDLVREEELEVCLIDDQAERWSGFLENALSNENVAVSSCSDPRAVLEGVRNAREFSPFERRLSIESNNATVDQVIFLDLRLFPIGDPRERQFFCDLCDEILRSSTQLGWHHDSQFLLGPLSIQDETLLSQNDWSKAQPLQALEDGKPKFVQAARKILLCSDISWTTIIKSPLYEKVLTLFARFVAQSLYSIPIVLFSSTGRRDLVEQFKGYGNIITAFEKPRIPVRADQVVLSFHQAMGKAVRILAARKKLRRFIDGGNAAKKLSIDESKAYHVELFLDEYHPGKKKSCIQNVWVGGFYSIFEADSVEAAQEKAAAFDDVLFDSGVAYYTRYPYGPKVRTRDKNVPTNKQLARAFENLKCCPKWKGRVRIKCDDRENGSELVSSGDDAYRRALATLSEAFLCESMPLLFTSNMHSNVTVSVFAGTRVTPAFKTNSAEMSRVNHSAYQWGFGVQRTPKKVLLESLKRSTLAPIIADVIEYRKMNYSIARAVAIRMIYDFDPNTKKPSFERDGVVVCRNCKTTHQVRADVSKKTKRWSAPPSPDEGDKVWGRIDRFVIDERTRNITAAILKLYDNDKKEKHECAHRSGQKPIKMGAIKWGDQNLSVNQYVQVEISWHDKLGHSVDRITEFGPQAELMSTVERKGIQWQKIKNCPNCSEKDTLRPDYPCGVYIADEIVDVPINDKNGYGRAIGIGPLDFNDVLDGSLHQMIEGGRCADIGDVVGAALKLAEGNVENYTGTDAVDTLKHRIVCRLAPQLTRMTGDEFFRFSSSLGSSVKKSLARL